MKGGAYFDVISFHSYPQFALSSWDNTCSCRKYYRHSDNAAKQVIVLRDKFETVLKNYGYDGKTFPSKYSIITETNIPSKSFAGQDHIGSQVAQRNFAIKMFVLTQKNDIKQSYIYTIGDAVDTISSTNAFQTMGLYFNLNKATPTNATPKDEGIAVKSLSGFIYGYAYNPAATTALNLPTTVEGAAFTKGTETKYVLWAKTTTDQNESPSAVSYSFPSTLNVQSIQVRNWDFSKTNAIQNITGKTISLGGSPSLISLTIATGFGDENVYKPAFSIYPNPAKGEVYIQYNATTKAENELTIVDMKGSEIQKHVLKENSEILPIFGLKTGVYQIQLTTEHGISTQKLVITE